MEKRLEFLAKKISAMGSIYNFLNIFLLFLALMKSLKVLKEKMLTGSLRHMLAGVPFYQVQIQNFYCFFWPKPLKWFNNPPYALELGN